MASSGTASVSGQRPSAGGAKPRSRRPRTGHRLVVVGASGWRPLIAEDDSLALAILRFLHDRHVGITPELATELARALRGSARGAGGSPDDPWSRAIARLTAELRPDSAGGPSARHQRGLVPARAPFFFVARIALPLVFAAVEAVGTTFLFADDPTPAPTDFDARYRRYAGELRAALRDRVDRPAVSWAEQAFWIESAHGLARVSHFEPRLRSVAHLPRLDPGRLRLMTELLPNVTEPTARGKLVRRPLGRPRDVVAAWPPEGGFDGLHLTRRTSELGQMLLSELAAPPELLAERIVHDGFLAHRRVSRRDRSRDVLLLGVMPDGLDPATALARSAWLDLVSRFAHELGEAGLADSEVRWLEGDGLGGRRDLGFVLSELPHGWWRRARGPRDRRRALLTALGWLDAMADLAAPFEVPDDELDDGGFEPLVDWTRRAIANARDHPHWPRHRTGGGASVPAAIARERFSFVRVNLFVPSSAAGFATDSAELARVRRALELDRPGARLTVTIVPGADSGGVESWRVVDGEGDIEELPAERVASDVRRGIATEDAVAGWLIERWLRDARADLSHD